jgi:MFS family permease
LITGTQAYKCYFNQGTVNPDGECQGPTTGAQGGITAAMTAGSWAGALVSGYLSDILGRRKAIMIGCVIWVIGSSIICAAQNIPMLVVGRIINGFCVGIQSAQVPVYISECVPPTKRGRLVGLQQWAITWVRSSAGFMSDSFMFDYGMLTDQLGYLDPLLVCHYIARLP